MTYRVDPTFVDELKKYGHVNIESCFNCGNCTAICPLSTSETPFPRNNIRRIQLGLKEQILESVDPWLCYYCGECTLTCPRQAEPAEAMMTMRRWLTAQYDRSGHGARLYTSSKAAWKAIVGYTLIPLILLVIFHVSRALGFHNYGGIVTDRVDVNAFAPTMWVWAIVLIDFALLGGRLFRSVINMFQLTMGAKSGIEPIPLSIYIAEFKTFLTHILTQKRWLDCEDCEDCEERKENRNRWLKHIFLVSGYGIMFVLIVGLLWWFQTDEIYPIYHPQRWLGYYATIVLLYTSGDALVGRIRKKEESRKFSHHSDWLFPGILFVGTLTGILLHIFRYAGWAWPTYIIYTIHTMVMIAMLDTEVGIGKWTHIFYRPLAIYFQAVKVRAKEYNQKIAAALAAN
ncbi:MAG: 4Fe-4S dicluster domain-containing protein [Anaerolineales bacterium]|nr:4Fe-4S dicluster domain-containing protein [Anaerolineales bacterium]